MRSALEVLALRQQVAVLKRKRPRPKLNFWDRLFWTTPRQFWSRWPDVLVLVKPDTVVAGTAPASVSIGAGVPGHAAADRRLPKEIRALIQRLRKRIWFGELRRSTASC